MSTDTPTAQTNGKTANATAALKARGKRLLPPLPTASAGTLADFNISTKLDGSPTNFESLPLYALFTLTSDGSGDLYIKIAKNKYASIKQGNSYFAGSGRCYRVIL